MSEDNSVTMDNQVVEDTSPDLLGSEPVDNTATVEENSVGPSEDFINSISEEYRGKVTQKGFKNADDIIKAYNNLESKFGKRIEDLTNDELVALDKKFGAPESVDGYELNLPEELVKDDPILRNIGQNFLDAGIPKEKASKLMEGVMSQIEEQVKMEQADIQIKNEENIKTLRQEFGTAFDERIVMANQALKEFGGQDAIEAITQAGLASNPAIVKMLSEVGKLIAEDKPVGGKESTSFGITPSEAAAKIAELNSDPAFLARVTNPNAPGHKEATAERERLYRIKAGKK